MTSQILKIFFFLAFSAHVDADEQYHIRKEKTYRFIYNKNWIVERPSIEGNCLLLLEKQPEAAQRHEIELCDYKKPLEEILSLTAFQNENNKWFAAGSMDIQEAQISDLGHGVTLLETLIPPSCGINDKVGFHSAGGQCYSAVVSNGKASVVIASDGVWRNFDAMRKMVRSITFSHE